jgi:uncharacterized small protein (DUF1192 family)
VEVAIQIFVALVVGGIAGLVASWLRFERFQSKYDEREDARKEWRAVVEKRLDNHALDLRSVGNHEFRLTQLEDEVKKLRERWHDLRGDTLEEVYALFRKWKDEMTAKFRGK